MSDTQDDPLPCPFCGGVPAVYLDGPIRSEWVCVCGNENCHAMPTVVGRATRIEAVRAWNTRDLRWGNLYTAINTMLAVLGYAGTINARDDRVQTVMDALHEIDEGVVRAHFQSQAEPVGCVDVRQLLKMQEDDTYAELMPADYRVNDGQILLYTSPPIPADMVMVPIDLMNELEWGSSNFDRYGVTQRYCPICGEQREDGHAEDCDLAKAMIAAAPKEAA